MTRQPLSGVEFKVAYADGRAIGDGRYFTDSRGEINITGINGTVTVTETATIPGAVFKVSDSSGAVLGNNNGEFTTDSHGEIVVSGLIPGTTVTVREGL